MPSKNLARIKSVPRHYVVALIACVAIAIAAIICMVFTTTGGAEVSAASYRLSLPGGTYTLATAASEAEQAKGLGGRRSLPPTEGMLFWSADTAERCFWMKDMHIAIDILWVDHGKRVVYIKNSVKSDTYPASYCAVAQYVIELNAGVAGREHIKIGQRLHF